jgi:hypothetical protein
MKLDAVDPVAVPIVGDQLRLVPVGVESPPEVLGGPGHLSELDQPIAGGLGALPTHRIVEDGIGRVEVVPIERGHLIQDIVGDAHNTEDTTVL